MPTTMSMEPSARPSLTFFISAAGTKREAWATLTGRPWKRSENVLKCWRARSVVGTTTATCLPAMAVDEGGAQRDLRLAEADVAADEPVHRPAGGEVVEHRVDGGLLVLGLLVGEAGRELVVEALAAASRRGASLQRARGRDLHQLARHLADALLHPRLARLPAAAAEPVELRPRSPPSRSAVRSSMFSTGRNSLSPPA